jgi:hypothetical protein
MRRETQVVIGTPTDDLPTVNLDEGAIDRIDAGEPTEQPRIVKRLEFIGKVCEKSLTR